MTLSISGRFAGKTVVVTGASSGIGREVACRLGAEGANVVLLARREEKLQELACHLEQLGRKSLPIRCDLTRPDEVASAVSVLLSSFGPPDVLVNCAGQEQMCPFLRTTEENIEEQIRVNLSGAMTLTRLVVSAMIRDKRTGCVVNIASVVGQVGVVGSAIYGAAKAALIGWTRCVALEWASKGIRVNCVAPGWVQTDMYERITQRLTEEQQRNIEEMHPLGLGTAADVAAAVAFLASDEARWITGTILTVDGGYTAQ